MSERRYGKWAGNPEGYPQNPERCVEEVWSNDRSMLHYQCLRKRGHGRDKNPWVWAVSFRRV